MAALTKRQWVAVARAALCTCGCLGLLALSSRVQSLLVFLQWLNWPPFDSTNPEKASPAWAHRVAALLTFFQPRLELRWRAFNGLTGAAPFCAKGSKGRLTGLHLPRSAPGRHAVLYLHGNAGNITEGHRVELYKILAAPPLVCNVYAIDYGGFGGSDGWWPDEESAVADVLAALGAIPESRRDTVVWGHSLGTGIAVGAMTRLLECGGELPKGLLLESPFTSVPSVVAAALPTALRGIETLLRCLLSAHCMPSLERIRRVAKSLHVEVLHGEIDDVVPLWQGRQLAEAASAPFHTFSGRGHEDIVEDPGLVKVVKSFFQACEEPVQQE